MRLHRLAFLLLLVAACGGQARPPLGAAITAPMNQWTWIDFPDSMCDDGSPTGIGVNLTGSPNLLVYMEGGGACWNYDTCLVLNTSAHGPFGKTQFDARVAQVGTGSIFDRTVAQSPWKDWNMVYVPYCTGDLHSGDRDVTYQGGGKAPVPFHHRGHTNFLTFVARIAGTVPSPTKAILTGASAGGYGTMINYDTFRQYFPTGEIYGLDDSGPPLIGDEVPPSFRAAFFAQWGLGDVTDPLCGMPCHDDISLLAPSLAKKYPHDRLALLETLQDKTISGYLLKSGPGLEDDLRALASQVLDPLAPNFRYFLLPGATHTMEGNPAMYTSTDGVNLWSWMTQMVTDDSSWTSHIPQ